jgi:hypothetical protein
MAKTRTTKGPRFRFSSRKAAANEKFERLAPDNRTVTVEPLADSASLSLGLQSSRSREVKGQARAADLVGGADVARIG